jgi:hypothetical protein
LEEFAMLWNEMVAHETPGRHGEHLPSPKLLLERQLRWVER